MAQARVMFGINPVILGLARRRGAAGERAGQAIRQAMILALGYWRRRMLPRHFEEDAPMRYAGAYTPRTSAYLKRKKREVGHTRPMVLTGRTRASLLYQRPFVETKLTRSSLRATLTLPITENVARWCNVARGRGVAHDFRRELTAVSRAEWNELYRFAEQQAARLLGKALEAASRRIILRRLRGRSMSDVVGGD